MSGPNRNHTKLLGAYLVVEHGQMLLLVDITLFAQGFINLSWAFSFKSTYIIPFSENTFMTNMT